jgi:hypothetical protein
MKNPHPNPKRSSRLHSSRMRPTPAVRTALPTAGRFLSHWWTKPWPTPRKLGATDAGAEVSEGCGLSVSVRNGELENVERNRDKSLGVTVYVGQRRGNASTSDFSDAAIAADRGSRLRHCTLHRRRPVCQPARRQADIAPTSRSCT